MYFVIAGIFNGCCIYGLYKLLLKTPVHKWFLSSLIVLLTSQNLRIKKRDCFMTRSRNLNGDSVTRRQIYEVNVTSRHYITTSTGWIDDPILSMQYLPQSRGSNRPTDRRQGSTQDPRIVWSVFGPDGTHHKLREIVIPCALCAMGL